MKTFVIAEAGINHNGSLTLAKQLAEAAKDAGADCVKFQTFIPEKIVSKFAPKAEYQVENTHSKESQLDMLRKLSLSFDEFKELEQYCRNTGILFLSTPFDLESIEFLQDLSIPFWKIPSGEITNFPYLRSVALTQKPVILSTGMANGQEISEALNVLRDYGCTDISLLHCTTEYPAPYHELNLLAIQTMKEQFHLKVGYSDHTEGIHAAIAAVAMGAEIIEKHFTLDRTMEGPDHRASLEPAQLQQMIMQIRDIEQAKGTGKKEAAPSERRNMAVARKSILAKCRIKKGDYLTEDNLTVKRPGNGISPMKWNQILGTRACRDYEEDELID